MLDGLCHVYSSIDQRYEVVGTISWGSPIWEAISARQALMRNNISAITIDDRRTMKWNGKPYWPFRHPSGSVSNQEYKESLLQVFKRIEDTLDVAR